MIDPSVPKSYEEVLGPETRTALRLAKLVQVASATDDPFNNPVDSPLDSTGILWLEHINLQVGNPEVGVLLENPLDAGVLIKRRWSRR